MNYLFLDIETSPLEIKDDYVIRYLMDKKLTNASRSLNPIYSKIILMGLKYNNEIKLIHGEEKEILNEFWNFIKDKDLTMVTHNGYKFDIPFIIIRSILNNVKITKEINTNPYSMIRSNHIDTMMIFSQNVFTNSGLRILAKLNKVEFDDDKVLGRDIEKFYNEGKLEEIKMHCKNDIEILEKLFNKICKDYVEKN